MKSKHFLLQTIVCLLAFVMATNLVNAEQRSSISQYGITWTFNHSYECGQFVTGDWWVVGPVVVNSVSPAPTSGGNGTVVNPMGGRQGYDSRIAFNPADRVSLPYTLQPGQSMVSSISRGGSSIINIGMLTSQAVLTSVSSPQAAGAFRPSYAGTYKKYFNESQIQWQLLPNLTPPASKPNGQDLIRYMDRPRIDHYNTWEIQKGCAGDNWMNGPAGSGSHPCYGRDYVELISRVAQYIMLNTPEKQELVRSMIQLGIDNYGSLKAGSRWWADGGHFSGRKFPILFAGMMLNDPAMLAIGTEYSATGFFGENDQTYYGNAGKALFGKPGVPTYFLNGCSGSGAKDVRDPNGLVDACPQYRNCCTSAQWVGQTLALLMLDAKGLWNHNSYFDYEDRWMSGDVGSVQYFPSGSSYDGFVNDMWFAYRNNLPSTNNTATPQFSPAPGNYTTAQNVTITTATSGATIRYTTNGTDPSTTNGTVYSGAISLSSYTQLKAIAYKSGLNDSPIATAEYHFDLEAPTVPQNVAVTGAGLFSVDLSWSASTDNNGVAGYNIYVNGVETQSSTTTSATVEGLEPSTTYSITVSAYDAAGLESAQSSAVGATTQNATLIAATSATASSYEAGTTNTPDKAIDGDINTRWAASGDGQWLQIQLNSQANISHVGIAFYLGNQRSYSFELQASTNGSSWTTVFDGSSSGLSADIEIFDVTEAQASYIRYVGHGNSSNTWNNVNEMVFYSAGPVEGEPPTVPTGLAVGTVTVNSVALSWNASTDNVGVAGYKVYTNGANSQTVTGTSATVGSLADGTQYTFTVSAIDAAGNESAQSGSVQATTVEITGVTSSTAWQSFQESTQTGEFMATFTAMPNGNNIDVLTGLQNGSASAYGDMACIIRFNTSGNIDARNGSTYTATNTVSYTSGVSYSFRVEVNVSSHMYSVYVTPAGGSEQTVASNFAFRTEQASVSQLTGWTVYGYQGTHTVDNMTFSTGVDTQAPGVPTGLASGTVTTTTVALSWNASSDNVGVTGYKVYTNGANPVTVTGTSSTITGLTATTQYNFSVSAYDEAGNESAQSGSIPVTTATPPDTEAPSVPGTPVVGAITVSSVALSWSASTDNIGVTGYKVYINGSNPQSVGGTSAAINGLADGTTYNFTVSAVDAAGNESAQSAQAQATTVEITGVTSSATWQSFQESAQTGTFTATFNAIPNGNNIDALTGLQNGTASAYGDMACIIRFNTSGNIDARNGGTYTATNTVSYSSGTSYAFRVEVNVPAHTYSVYVTPQGGSEQTVASNFAFRTEQASVSQITGWTVYGYQGTHTVDNMVFDDGSTPDTETPSVPSGLAAGTVTTTSVALSWSASSDNVGVTGYKVYTDGANPQTVAGTSTTINGLTASTQYSFTVSAADAAGNESVQSASLQVTTDDVPTGIDLIANGEFDNGTTGWEAGNYGGTAGLSTVTGQGMSGTNAMLINISSAGSNPWEIQISQDISIESGKTYEISFMAKATTSRSIDAVIQDFDAPYSEYWHEDINLITSAQSFGPYTFNSAITDATCRFKFFVGGSISDVYVDNIVVSDVTSSSAQIFAEGNSKPSFIIYPNPLNGDVLNVSMNGYDTEDVNVIVHDVMGKTLYQKVYSVNGKTILELPLSDLSKGIYIITLHGKTIAKQQKFIVD